MFTINLREKLAVELIVDFTTMMMKLYRFHDEQTLQDWKDKHKQLVELLQSYGFDASPTYEALVTKKEN